MALLGAESWDLYATADVEDYWQNLGGGTIVDGVGRCGSKAYHFNSAAGNGPQIGANATTDTGYVGFAWQDVLTQSRNVININDVGGTAQLLLLAHSNGALSVYAGPNTVLGTHLGTSATQLVTSNHYYHIGIAFKTANAPNGWVKVYVNGVLILNITGVKTYSSTIFAGTSAGDFRGFRMPGSLGYVDDIYWGDSSGPAPWNAFLGDLRVEGQVALTDADGGGGTYQDFTTSTGSDHGALVDDIPPDDDSTYVQSATVGHTETFVFPNITLSSGTVYGIQLMPNMKKSDAGGRTMACVVLQGATLTVGTTQGISQTDYNYTEEMFQTNPTTGTAWTATTADNMEGGIQITS